MRSHQRAFTLPGDVYLWLSSKSEVAGISVSEQLRRILIAAKDRDAERQHELTMRAETILLGIKS